MSMRTAVDIGVIEDLLQELECPVCSEYMHHPIYLCATGHSICGSCKIGLLICPLCSDSMLCSRNYTLEKISYHIKFNCKYKDLGCAFISTSDEIKKHEVDCEFNTCDCPFEKICICAWSGRRIDVLDHIQTHNALLSNNGSWFSIAYQNENENKDYSFGIKAFENIFKLLFKIENGTCCWSMQLIGPGKDASKYMFEVDMKDNVFQRRIFIREKCNIFGTEVEAFNSKAAFIVLTHQTVNSFKKRTDENNVLKWICRIVKPSSVVNNNLCYLWYSK
ncbi:hypothetical protein ILUMI_12079 [Ignelater luminosus]|uniref:E3 ubiquitin-protein ligase n=1 Tax=Ignelater luminosus TaxID=2038154 RepID=A0A8K0G741_IGNLU|nr:hypothetical protein ILUMI_12079 [Ignelater luminosus]